jgi:antitoxin (DNA-binding transcriptional repressor) of toxin-antitoxin stability system
VINYSVGGGASLSGADDIAYLFAADAGVFVATSAGNAGPGAGTIGGPASAPWVTSVGASTQPRFFQGTVRLGNGRELEGSSVTRSTRTLRLVDAASAGGDLCEVGRLDPAKVKGAMVLCRRGGNGRAEKSFAVQQAGGAGMVLYNNDNVDNLFTDNFWVPTVHLDNTPGLAVKRYIARSGRPTARIVANQRSTWPSAPSMAVFSSRGPNTVPGANGEDIIKPTSRRRVCRSWPATLRRRTRACWAALHRVSCSRRSPVPRCPARMWPGCWPWSSRHTRTGPRAWPSPR